ncbi:MAG TPA: GAF domain-containing protein [Chloroflexi bacterium]|nr:GAF domain-containing protein [Chloroflexota bacterium]
MKPPNPSKPLPEEIDAYLLALRWGMLVATAIIYWLVRFPPSASPPPAFLLDPRLVFIALLAYNVPVSLYCLRERPIAAGRPWLLLLSDTVISLGLVGLTGGHLSAFFLIFLIAIIEAALAFRWQTALVLIVLLDTLQLLIFSFLGPQVHAIIIINRFVAFLVFGISAILFGEGTRREEAERQEALAAAERERTLNEIFFELGKSGMNPEKVFQVLLESTHRLLNAACALIALEVEDGTLRVAASTSPHHPPGKALAAVPWPTYDEPLVVTRRNDPAWPSFIRQSDVRQLLAVPLRSATQKPLGWLMVGMNRAFPLAAADRNLLKTLGLEAGLALHNAQLYRREEEHVRELEHFSEMRANFFSALGHELKTPLTALKTLGPSLERLPDLPPETRAEITESIQINLERLDGLINELFESLRLEANMVALHPTSLDVRARIQHNLAALRPVLEQKKLQVETDLAPDLPRAQADPRRFDQILGNLLHNAVKFSPEGGVIRVDAAPEANSVRICVEDAGPGIPPEERERIFDKFAVVSQRKAMAGVGLGLFISRELVRLHGGTIWVEDASLGGSRFCFTLPLATKDTREPPPSPSSGDRHGKSHQAHPGH